MKATMLKIRIVRERRENLLRGPDEGTPLISVMLWRLSYSFGSIRTLQAS